MRDGIEAQRAAGQRDGFIVLRAPQQRLDARFQFFQLEGFGEVIVGTHVQAADTIGQATTGGEDQHRCAVATGAHAFEHFQSIHARQRQVEDHQRVILRQQQAVGIGAVVGAFHGEVGIAHGLGQPA